MQGHCVLFPFVLLIFRDKLSLITHLPLEKNFERKIKKRKPKK